MKQQTQTPDTTKQKELHTQGDDSKWFFEWETGRKSSKLQIVNDYRVICEMNYDQYNEVMQNHSYSQKQLANAELIVKAVNERKALLDSHRELLEIVKRLDTWHHLENGVFTYTDPKKDGDQLTIDLQTAINNAKNIKQ